jgi:hypothetical protein
MIAPALAPATFTHFLTGFSGCSANPNKAPAASPPDQVCFPQAKVDETARRDAPRQASDLVPYEAVRSRGSPSVGPERHHDCTRPSESRLLRAIEDGTG